MFVLGAIFHETGLVWAQPMADALSLLLAAGLYFRISSKAYIKWRRVAATGIKAALIHQRFMVSAFDSLAVAHRDKQAGDRQCAVTRPVLGQRPLTIGGKICVIIARIRTWSA